MINQFQIWKQLHSLYSPLVIQKLLQHKDNSFHSTITMVKFLLFKGRIKLRLLSIQIKYFTLKYTDEEHTAW